MGRSLEVAVAPTCISSGYCRNSAPDVFGQAADRKSVVKSNPVEESEALWEAMEGCPVEAISAKDSRTGDIVFPED
ncbi:MAG: ferredoxin [Frankiaceae bacterium]|nr:ferredoxin [Frankiaceae bacterium]